MGLTPDLALTRHDPDPSSDGKVSVLPGALADQIAAGEVVERPASAVKELIENSLDAGATRVTISLTDGGLTSIRVEDNGSGMGPRDARMAVERHATSKLREESDLFAIRSFGFRGEALPSIASVSHLTLRTQPHGALEGTQVRVQGGEVMEVSVCSEAPGTSLRVDQLFFNTPARYKFLKTRATEVRHVVSIVQRYALAYPQVSFVLEAEGRTLHQYPSVVEHSARLAQVLGVADAKQLYPAEEAARGEVRVHGFVGAPALTRRTTEGQWTYVNRRYVRDKVLQQALRAGYENLVDRGRYPVAVLFVEVPAHAVDVNVHPMKIEVRFRERDDVFRATRAAVRDTLAAAPWVVRQPTDAAQRHDDRADSALSPRGAARSYVLRPFTAEQGHDEESGELFHRADSGTAFATRRTDTPERGGSGPAVRDAVPEHGPPVTGRGYFSGLRYLGSVLDTYLVAADEQGLVVVDQHAAHERITFERLREQWQKQAPQIQRALIPLRIALDGLRASVLEEHLELFGAMGYEIEPFGGTDFVVHGVPALLGSRADHGALLRDAVDELASGDQSRRMVEAVEAVLLRMACHQSVRAGDRLHAEEAYALFREMDVFAFASHCPHGRPVWFHMKGSELETRFGRR